jgi:NADPH:quinone reductase
VPDGGLLIKTLYLSVDPHMRGCMTGLANYYIPQFELADPLFSMGVGEVLESRDPAFSVGDLVLGELDWSPAMVWDPAKTSDRVVGGILQPIVPGAIAPSHYLGALGTTGITAFFGVLAVAQPQPGETFLVSSAASGVGSIAGQIAKLRGAHVYGLTSTKEKRDVLTQRLDFVEALDYRSPTLADELRESMPTGPDI